MQTRYIKQTTRKERILEDIYALGAILLFALIGAAITGLFIYGIVIA